jgi:exopolysaccharide biosynthesis polyprenyl glycosylphosphotransferase
MNVETSVAISSDTSVPEGGLLANDDLVLDTTPNVVSEVEIVPGPFASTVTVLEAVEPLRSTEGDELEPETGFEPKYTETTPPRHWTHQWVKAGAVVVADVASLAISFVVGLAVAASVSDTAAKSLSHLGEIAWVWATFSVVTLAWFAVYGLYRQQRRRLRPHAIADAGRLFHALTAGTLVTLGIATLIHRSTGFTQVAPAQIIVAAAVALVMVPLGRGMCRLLWHGRFTSRARVLIVGSGLMADQIRRHCGSSLDLEVVGLVDDDPVPDTETLGRIADIPRLCADLSIDRIIVSFSRSHPSATVDQLRAIQGTVPISVIPRYFELLSWRSQLDDFDGLPVFDIAPQALSRSARFIKRSFDLVGATLGLIVLAPVVVAVVIAIKCSSTGPVLFSQTRVGRKGKLFTVYKFRTMRVGAQVERPLLDGLNLVDGPLFKMSDDPRVFPVGSFLRRFSLDEIPQLVNVLLGQMSLVGPRPFIPEESARLDGWSVRRLDVRPGMTGLWQVSGRNDLSSTELCRLDYVYVASWSFWWDLRILWSTPSVIVRALGAY